MSILWRFYVCIVRNEGIKNHTGARDLKRHVVLDFFKAKKKNGS